MTPVEQRFILHWGEMGTKWGINRTVAQIHALLYLSPKPLTADEITEALSVARSNVSTSLKELQGWGIVKVVHSLGDRRDHFESLKDVWEMFQIIVDERKRREVDPTVAFLQGCLAEARQDPKDQQYTMDRLNEMMSFFETMSAAYNETRRVPLAVLKGLVRAKGKVAGLLASFAGKS